MLVTVVRDVELHGRSREVTVEEVVHSALRVDNQRDLDHHDVELSAEVSLDIVLQVVSFGFCSEA
jgi:hypothetical protein